MTDPGVLEKMRAVMTDIEAGAKVRAACAAHGAYHSHFLKVVAADEQLRLRYANLKKVRHITPGKTATAPVGDMPTIQDIRNQAIKNVWEKIKNDPDGKYSLDALRVLAQANVTDKPKNPLEEIDIDSFVEALEDSRVMDRFKRDPNEIKEAITNGTNPAAEDGDQ